MKGFLASADPLQDLTGTGNRAMASMLHPGVSCTCTQHFVSPPPSRLTGSCLHFTEHK